MNIVLASASPRRKELLSLIRPDFKVITADADETSCKLAPQDIVCDIAHKKAEAVSAKTGDDDIIISADTLVFLNNKRLGKPKDSAQAFSMLAKLSGCTHKVYTGICIMKNPKNYTLTYECTEVTFAPLSDKEIADYIATNDCFDKAGAYGIQGYASRFISRINGCYFNVVGLPIHKLYSELKKFSPEVL